MQRDLVLILFSSYQCPNLQFPKTIPITKKRFNLCTLCFSLSFAQLHWSYLQRQKLKCAVSITFCLCPHSKIYKMHTKCMSTSFVLLVKKRKLNHMACQNIDCLITEMLVRFWHRICSTSLTTLLFKAGSASCKISPTCSKL